MRRPKISPSRALEATCVALRREVEGEREGQLRARGKSVAALPRGVGVLSAAAIASVREQHGHALSTGTCLAVIGFHFLATWRDAPGGPMTRSRRVRERDQGWCQVPRCSRNAAHAHHIDFRSHGGSDDPQNLVGLCAFHHLRCIHGGFLAVLGRAPGELCGCWAARCGPGHTGAARRGRDGPRRGGEMLMLLPSARGRAQAWAGAPRGRVTVNVVPWPGSLSSETEPPCARTISRTT
ncbi:HNH endonuclease [Anaeromyxobacter dehalogenans]|uniref:HNH endonuclease n=1 Tax=Anaeromyxobacter dehalogenans TaxID=161493 RepID=UPI001FE1A401|nr:HNH endonuclease signature motif containing protein [Anaeromyxobacter dehalogenans]